VLFLLFQLGQDRYALDASTIAAVLPLVSILPIPQMPPAVAGLLNHRGTPIPVIDLSQALLGRPALRRLGTRIVLVNYASDSGAPQLLGLIAEGATGTLRREPADFVQSGVSAPHLGPVARYEGGLAQWVGVNQLLPASVRDLLFRLPTQH
jgi:chemotaxis-related protein WspB